MNRYKKSKPRRKTWIPLLIVLLIAAGGFGYLYWKQTTLAQAAAATPTLRTTTVRRGSITLSASGAGTLTTSVQNQLSFPTAGTVAKLTVQPGDQVKKGQELAQLGNLDTLQSAVNSAQQDLISAQQALDTLKASAPANLANAQLNLTTAQKAVTDAKSAVVQKGTPRCDQTTTDAYYSKYMQTKNALDALGDGGGNPDYYLKTIVPAKNRAAQAYAAYQYCAGFTSYEIDASHAKLALAEAQLTQAQTDLTTLQKNNGVDPMQMATAQNKVDNAQSALDQAKANLDGATIKAPYDGTIISVAGQAGDNVGTSTFITIADLAHPQVTFQADETDLDKVAIGESAQVTFDALPNKTFTGKVIRIDPALLSSGGTQVLQGLIQLDLTKETDLSVLPQGLTASVILIKAQANNVLTVPIQALRDLGGGNYAVFVVGQNDQLQLKPVTVGLMDAATAEIKSGLSAGQVVSTGNAQTQ